MPHKNVQALLINTFEDGADVMDIVKASVEWTKAEAFSSAFFILFGVAFLVASLGFWQLGKTEVARAYTIPTLVAGVLLLIIGVGIFFPSLARITSFPAAYENDAVAFIAGEVARSDTILGQYKLAVYRIIPLIVLVCAALIIFFEGPIWRASFVTTIAMMGAIMLIDTNANARLEIYRAKLAQVEKQE